MSQNEVYCFHPCKIRCQGIHLGSSPCVLKHPLAHIRTYAHMVEVQLTWCSKGFQAIPFSRVMARNGVLQASQFLVKVDKIILSCICTLFCIALFVLFILQLSGAYMIYLFLSSQIHYIDVIMSAMASQITSITIVTQPFIQEQIKENIKTQRHWPLWGEFTGDRWMFPENVPIWWRHHVFRRHKSHSKVILRDVYWSLTTKQLNKS